jgi:hypothetical protein
MKIRWLAWLIAIAAIVVAVRATRAAPVDVPRGVDHAPYDALLKKYVSEAGLVNYRAWKASADDMKTLRNYTGQFAKAGDAATGDEKVASLINAYNALTIQWILENHPVRSIKDTKNPWGAKRHTVGGRRVSLDEVEHETLRPLVGYRIHAALVCAAKSCPPLRAGAWSAEKLDAQLDDAMRRWLARDDLNHFSLGRAELSKIFSWYGKDFGDLPAMLNKYAPVTGDFEVSFKRYDWSLNGQ